jgi:hypothetical protein
MTHLDLDKIGYKMDKVTKKHKKKHIEKSMQKKSKGI